jgi:hypothetical protein
MRLHADLDLTSMIAESDPAASWRVVALELLRRLAGAPPTMLESRLRAAGAPHLEELRRRGIDSLYFAACDPEHPRQRMYQVLWRAQRGEAQVVLESIQRHGAEVVVFKGIEVGARYRPSHGLYRSADIDLLATGAGLPVAEHVLYERGYRHRSWVYEEQAWNDIEPRALAQFRASAYELGQYMTEVRIEDIDPECRAMMRDYPRHFRVEGRGAHVAVCFDVHRNILFNFDVAPLWARAVPSALGVGGAFCPGDHLWFLIHRYYFEVASGSLSELRVLAPIAAVVNDPAVDWSLVLRNAVEFNATAPFLYWLTFFQRLGAPGISTQLLEQLRAHHARSQRNWGWQLGRLFETEEPFPENILA